MNKETKPTVPYVVTTTTYSYSVNNVPQKLINDPFFPIELVQEFNGKEGTHNYARYGLEVTVSKLGDDATDT